jgi:hypothetical protein
MNKSRKPKPFLNKPRDHYKIDRPPAPMFANRAERDAYYSQRTIERQLGAAGGGGVTVQPSTAIDPQQTIDVPDSLVAMLRLIAWTFRKFEGLFRFVRFMLALMMATIIAGIMLGILAA